MVVAVVAAVWLLTRVHYYGGRVEKFVMHGEKPKRASRVERSLSSLLDN